MEIKYKKFWNWFVQNKELFEGLEISDQSVELIDQEITALGDVTWEIGPGKLKPWSLTISPGGNPDILSLTKKIISYAPILSDWEFNYAKPMKEWDNYFDVIVNGEEVGVDISKWKYVLFKTEDNRYDIEIKLIDTPSVVLAEKDEILYGIIEMVLESILGEETRLEKINELEVVRNPGLEEMGSSILHLSQHLDALT